MPSRQWVSLWATLPFCVGPLVTVLAIQLANVSIQKATLATPQNIMAPFINHKIQNNDETWAHLTVATVPRLHYLGDGRQVFFISSIDSRTANTIKDRRHHLGAHGVLSFVLRK